MTIESSKRITLPAKTQLRAMILLALNGWLGNTDISMLEIEHIDFESSIVDYARNKTAIDRRFPLWPETAEALKAQIENRRQARLPEHAKLVFINRLSGPMVNEEPVANSKTPKITVGDYVAKQFNKLRCELGLSSRKGVGFYGGMLCAPREPGASAELMDMYT